MSATTLVSPNEMMGAGKRMMLDGREPESDEDWVLLINFLACNVTPDVASSAVPFICMIFDCPVSDGDIQDIVTFQVAQKYEEASHG